MRRWAPPLGAALAAILAAACTGVGSRRAASPLPSPMPPPTSVPSPSPSPVPEPAFDVGRAMQDVRTLALDIGVRRAGKGGDRRAAEFIAGRLAQAGLQVSLLPFPLPAGGETWNVAGLPTPEAPERGRYLLVGAHYDTTEDSPGANDNATGVAVMLELARVLAARPVSLPVVFVAFGAEEVQPGPRGTHHLGSRRWVETMSPSARAHLVAMLSLDMVGWGPGLVCARLATGPREATERLLRLGGELGIPVRERVTPDWSDNGPFLRAGLNAGWIWAGPDLRYHSPRDTVDHVQPESVERAGRLALAFLRSWGP